MVSEINKNVEYTDSHRDEYREYSGDNSADPWGQYDSGLQGESYWVKDGIVVLNTISAGDDVRCFHYNPDISEKAENGQNPEDSAIYVEGTVYYGMDDFIQYEVYLHDGRIIRISKDGSILNDYPEGEDIKTVREEYRDVDSDEFGHLLEMAFPGASGIDHDPSWMYVMPTDNSNVSFDGSSYHIRACGYYDDYDRRTFKEYILDSDTEFDLDYDYNRPHPHILEDYTAYQWFTRYFNSSEFTPNRDCYEIKVNGNHIDAFRSVTSAYW